MQLITKQEIANEAKDHWKMQYFKDGSWKQAAIGDTEVVYNNLVSLVDGLKVSNFQLENL